MNNRAGESRHCIYCCCSRRISACRQTFTATFLLIQRWQQEKKKTKATTLEKVIEKPGGMGSMSCCLKRHCFCASHCPLFAAFCGVKSRQVLWYIQGRFSVFFNRAPEDRVTLFVDCGIAEYVHV